MVYFCADDYGISVESNTRIEDCINNGILNKISVLPNGEISDPGQCIFESNIVLSLHINLIEGRPLSSPDEINLLVSDDGTFKYSFGGLCLLSLFGKRKELEKQLYNEIQSQIKFWKTIVGQETAVWLDGHQHTHMIPLVFKTLMRVIKDEKLKVERIRIPAEPILPYIMTPSLYLSYSPVGLVKQWVLKILALVNSWEIKKSKIPYTYFFGVLFSGKLDETKLKKLLPKYIRLAEKNNRDVEIGFHPGYFKTGENPLCGYRKDFEKFYFSPWRKIEYDTLLNFKF